MKSSLITCTPSHAFYSTYKYLHSTSPLPSIVIRIFQKPLFFLSLFRVHHHHQGGQAMAADWGLAELYVQQKLHKEKMKAARDELDDHTTTDRTTKPSNKKKSNWFLGMVRKVHPSNSAGHGVVTSVARGSGRPCGEGCSSLLPFGQ